MSRTASAAVDELEVKARVDDPAALRAALVRAGAVLEFRGDMLDRRFDRAAKLADRDEVLRVRVFREGDGAPAYGVLGWKGPHAKQGRYRCRAEAETRVGDPEGVVEVVRPDKGRGRDDRNAAHHRFFRRCELEQDRPALRQEMVTQDVRRRRVDEDPVVDMTKVAKVELRNPFSLGG